MTRARSQSGTDPSQLPEIRDWIVANLQPGRPLRNVMDLETFKRYSAGENAGTTAYVELHGMTGAKLFWVPKHERDLIVNASTQLPPDMTLSPDDLPYPSGFAVFEEPFIGIDADTGESMGYATKALRWSPINVLDTDGSEIGEAVSMSSWCVEWNEVSGSWLWMPLGRTDWRYGQKVGEYFGSPTPSMVASVLEDRARFMGLWALMNAQDPMVYRPTRSEARRDARVAPMSPNRLINVVKWDPARYQRDNPSPTGRRMAVRIWVDSFWARRAYGPQKSKRHWTLIPGHYRGPEDAPIKGQTITINKVVSNDPVL